MAGFPCVIHPWVICSSLHDLYAMSCLFRVPGVFHETHDHAPCSVPDGAHTQVSTLSHIWGVLLSWAGKQQEDQILHWSYWPLVLAVPLTQRAWSLLLLALSRDSFKTPETLLAAWVSGDVSVSLQSNLDGESSWKCILLFLGPCQLYQRTIVASLLQWRSAQRLQAICVCTVGVRHAARKNRSPLAPSTTKRG